MEKKELFIRMQELSNGTNEEELNFFINQHQDLLKIDPIQFIGLHISFYANQEKLLESLSVVEHYKNAPYISMEVEEFLNEMKSELTKLKEPSKSEINDTEIVKFLYSKNENAVVSALHVLSKKNIRNYLPIIKNFLVSDVPYKYKTLALFILIEQNIEEDIIVTKDGLEYSLSPYLLELPFDSYSYIETKEEIEKSKENEDIIQSSIEILNTVQIKNYPDTLLDNDNTKFMAEVFIATCKSFLGLDTNIKMIAKKNDIDVQKVEELINEIKKVFNS